MTSTTSAGAVGEVVWAVIPSPPQGVWHLGPFPLRAYALAIIAGVVVAIWLGNRRWVARGGQPGTVADMAVWAVPAGLVGARLYHVITDYQLYFGADRNPLQALAIWNGGLGIWGGVAGGAVGAWFVCRRRGIPLPALADALAPGIVLAQAVGRLGNWFNQELFGKPTDLPWALAIDPRYRSDGYEQYATFHPTFLYELIWNVGVAALVILADRRFRLGHGRAFMLYVAGYTAGRGWIEYMRIDEVNHILGLRLNVWTSVLVFLAAVVGIVVSARRHPGRERVVEPHAGAEQAEQTEQSGESPTEESADLTDTAVVEPDAEYAAGASTETGRGEGAAATNDGDTAITEGDTAAGDAAAGGAATGDIGPYDVPEEGDAEPKVDPRPERRDTGDDDVSR